MSANIAIRIVFFDAGNTLLRMDYEAIAGRLTALGFAVTPEAVERAEWRARVRLDGDVFARRAPGVSTESGDTGRRYVGYLLEGLGVADDGVTDALTAWRRAYNPPVGLWTRAQPGARAALALARRAGLRTAVISNSDGTVRTLLDRVGLTPDLDFVLDSSEEGVEKPDPRLFAIALARAGLGGPEAAYVGDLYSIDVLGARAVGIRPVLLDPGGHWAGRDCATASTVLDAVRLIVSGRGA